MEDRSASVGKYLVTMDDLQFIVTFFSHRLKFKYKIPKGY